jgi:hypothetical protein
MHDPSSKETKQVRVPEAWLKFNLKPKYHGDFVFLDAQDLDFYEQV